MILFGPATPMIEKGFEGQGPSFESRKTGLAEKSRKTLEDKVSPISFPAMMTVHLRIVSDRYQVN